MDKQKLRAVLALHGYTQRTLAEYLGLSENRLSNKINGTGGADFTQTEILLIKDKFGLSSEQLDKIFFNSDVS